MRGEEDSLAIFSARSPLMPVSGNSPQSPRSPASTTPASTPASPFAAQLQQIPLPKSPAGPSQRLLALCSECSALLQQPAGDAAAPLAALGSLARREPALLWQHERALRPLCALLLQCGRHDALVAEVVTQALSHGGEAYADVAVAAAAWVVAGPADERRLQGVKTILYHAHRAVAVPLLRRLLAAAGTERQLHARGGEALGVCALECAEVAFASWSEGALASVEEALADALLRVSSSPSARVQAAWALALQAAHRRGKAEHGRADEWSAVAHSLADACGEHHPSTAALRATLGETTLGEAVGAAPPPLAAGPSFHIAAPVAGPISRGWAWLLSLAPWRPPRLGLALVALGLALAALASSARVDVGGGPASVVGGALFAPVPEPPPAPLLERAAAAAAEAAAAAKEAEEARAAEAVEEAAEAAAEATCAPQWWTWDLLGRALPFRPQPQEPRCAARCQGAAEVGAGGDEEEEADEIA